LGINDFSKWIKECKNVRGYNCKNDDKAIRVLTDIVKSLCVGIENGALMLVLKSEVIL
jgi:hypothetical protein